MSSQKVEGDYEEGTGIYFDLSHILSHISVLYIPREDTHALVVVRKVIHNFRKTFSII